MLKYPTPIFGSNIYSRGVVIGSGTADPETGDMVLSVGVGGGHDLADVERAYGELGVRFNAIANAAEVGGDSDGALWLRGLGNAALGVRDGYGKEHGRELC